MEVLRGRIKQSPSVWCGVCGNWEWVDEFSARTASKAARLMGWIYTRKLGWVCPSCKDKKQR